MVRLGGTEVKAFLFDWYLTLVEFDELLPTCADIIRAAGYPCSDELADVWLPAAFDGCQTPVGPGGDYRVWRMELLRALLTVCSVPPREQDELAGRILATEEAHRAHALPGAREVLTFLREQGVRVGVCSNWDYDLTYSLECSGLGELVDGWVTSVQVGARKPHARIFGAACHEIGAEAEQVAFCGDTWSTDIAGALRAGLMPIWLSRQAIEIPHVRIAASLEELLHLLRADLAENWA
ncbi:MAG TPA: HAD family hydrolase [Streptosporangiaceae bacterium]